MLSVPAINRRALEKVHDLDCDAVIFDLEDSVSPDRKAEARDNLIRFFAETPLTGRESIIRINAPDTAVGLADLQAVLLCQPDAVLLPKVDEPQDIMTVVDFLAEQDAPEQMRIWAMIETPRAILNIAALAESGRTSGSRVDCFVVGLNDLRKDTHVADLPGRPYLMPWLMQVVLAARAYGLDVLDSVCNDFRDLGAFASECAQGHAMGFDGKMLIHPAQITDANRCFGPQQATLTEAQAILAAFAVPEAQGLNVITVDGRMVERLHLQQAERLVETARLIAARKEQQP